ncbi:LPP20 family lipoprotein [candidate division KSB1 bacterium]|nr:LPP20 family lipoprotein [candidate division KSB1 bacterium]
MRNKILISLMSLLVLIFVGCAGTGGGWQTFTMPTNPDYLFATGNGESKQLQLAIDKAALNARTEIGRQMELKLNSLQKSFAEEVGNEDPELNQLYSAATKAVVSTQLMGSKIKEKKYRERNGKYEAVVMVEYPLQEANKALVNQIKKEKNLYTRFRASQGFKELEAEIEKMEN